MHFQSTLNPANKSTQDAPIVVLRHQDRAVFAPRLDTYTDMVTSVMKRFDLNTPPVLAISSLDVCRGEMVEVDVETYALLAPALDELNVLPPQGASTRVGVSKPRFSNQAPALAATSTVISSQSKRIPRTDSSIDRARAISIARALHSSTSRQKPKEASPSGSDLLKGSSSSGSDRLREGARSDTGDHRPLETPRTSLEAEEPEQSFIEDNSIAISDDEDETEDEEGAVEEADDVDEDRYEDSFIDDEAVEDEHTEDEEEEEEVADEVVETPRLPRSTKSRRVDSDRHEPIPSLQKQLFKPASKLLPNPSSSSKVKPTGAQSSSGRKPDAPPKDEKTLADELFPPEEPEVKSSARIASPPASTTSKAKSLTSDSSSSKPASARKSTQAQAQTKASPGDESAVPAVVNPQFIVNICHPPTSEDHVEFRVRATHKVQKVLRGACKTFGVDSGSAVLVHITLSSNGRGGGKRIACREELMLGECGIEEGARLEIEEALGVDDDC